MHSHRVPDCYCKTRVPTTKHRSEVHSKRNCNKFESKHFFCRTETTKRIPLTSTQTAIENLENTEPSRETSPPSPIYSPDTSNALENAEKVIKDALMQITEINMTCNRRRVPKNRDLYCDEPPIDDENDRVLYIRERVAVKFSESNSDDYAAVANSHERQDENHRMINRKSINLSSSKFNTCNERFEEFSKNSKYRTSMHTPLLGGTKFKHSTADNLEECNGTAINVNEIGGRRRNLEDEKKIGNFCIQTGPPVNINRRLAARHLESIHISPDPSFVQENTNVGCYAFQHNSCETTNFQKRKEKMIKISETDGNISSNVKTVSNDQRHKSSDDISVPNVNVCVKEVRIENSAKNSEICDDQEEVIAVSQTPNTLLECKENFTSTIPNDLIDFQSDQASKGKQHREVETPICVNLNTEEDVNLIKNNVINAEAKPTFSNDNGQSDLNKQRCCENVNQRRNVEVQCEQKNSSLLCDDIKILQHHTKLYRDSVTSDNVQDCQHISSKNDVPTGINEEESNRKKDERYENVKQRFANIFSVHCQKDKKTYKSNSLYKLPRTESLECLEETLYMVDDLYHPSIDDVDDILKVYYKKINSIAVSTKAIEKFLSRSEIAEYSNQSDTAVTESSTSLHLVSSNNRKLKSVKTPPFHHLNKQSTLSKSKNVMFHDQSTLLDHRLQRNKGTQIKPMQTTQEKTFLSLKANHDLHRKNKCTVTGRLTKLAVCSDLRKRERVGTVEKLQSKALEDSEQSSTSTSTDNKLLTMFSDAKWSPTQESSFLTSSRNPSSLHEGREAKQISEIISIPSNNGGVKDDINLMSSVIKKYLTSEVIDIRGINSNYSALCNITQPDSLKPITSKLVDSTAITHHLITATSQDEKQMIGNDIISGFKETEINSVKVTKFLEHLQNVMLNSRSEDMQSTIFKNLLTNIEISGLMPTDNFESLHIVQNQEAEENFSDRKNVSETEPIKENIIGGINLEGSIESRVNVVDSPTLQLSKKSSSSVLHTENENSKFVSETKNTSDGESSKEISNIKNDSNNSLRLTDTISKPCLSNTTQRILSEENERIGSVVYNLREINRENSGADIEGNCSNNNRESMPMINEKINCVNQNSCGNNELLDKTTVSAVADGNALIYNTMVNNLSVVNVDQTVANTEKKIPSVDNSSSQITLSESLHDDASHRTSSSRNLQGTLPNDNEMYNIDTSYHDTRTTAGYPKVKCVYVNRISNETRPFCKTECKTGTTINEWVPLNQNDKSSNSMPSNTLKKTETSSEPSHSDGELHMSSSCSYSLGEIRVLNKNDMVADTMAVHNNITIFVTKNMLNSSSESSNPSIESIGEI